MYTYDAYGAVDREPLSPEPTIHDPVRLTDVELGAWTEIHAGCRLHEATVDDYSYLTERVQVDVATIGRFCSVAADTRIGPPNHPTGRPSGHHFTYRADRYDLGEDDAAVFEWRRGQSVAVGHDVWIGHGAVVLPGVTVGNGAVVAAGAVVADDVAPYTVAAGVPAEPIGRRFPPDVAAAVEATRWWEWDHGTIRERLDAFRDIELFLEEYAPGDVDPGDLDLAGPAD